MSAANYFHVKGDDKYTRSVECDVFMITNGRIPTIDEMTTDGLRSMSDIDLVDLRMPSRQWELQTVTSHPADASQTTDSGHARVIPTIETATFQCHGCRLNLFTRGFTPGG